MHPSIPPAQSRQIVIVPRAESDRPDVPTRIPTHYCMECGQHHVKCWQCDLRVPIHGTHDGYHFGHCDTHGQIVFICPAKPALTSNECAALGSQPADVPRRLTHIPETMGHPLDLAHDRRMREHIRVGAACLAIGFLLCAVLVVGAHFLGRIIGG